MSTFVWSKQLAIVGVFVLGFAWLVSAAAQPCSITGAESQVLLFQDAHYTVVASPSSAVVIDLNTGYPPVPGQSAPYVYDTNFHPMGTGTQDAPLTVRVCPTGVSPTTTWDLQLSLDDLLFATTNAQIPAGELYYSRRLQRNWTSASNTPTTVYVGSGPLPQVLYFYFQARLSGAEKPGVYQGALHFAVLATTP